MRFYFNSFVCFIQFNSIECGFWTCDHLRRHSVEFFFVRSIVLISDILILHPGERTFTFSTLCVFFPHYYFWCFCVFCVVLFVVKVFASFSVSCKSKAICVREQRNPIGKSINSEICWNHKFIVLSMCGALSSFINGWLCVQRGGRSIIVQMPTNKRH